MATIKHIFKGESLSMLFAFPAGYDMARIQSHGIWIGGTEFTGVIVGQGIELKLTSIQTDLMSGNQRVSLWIDDSQLGVRKPYVGDLAVRNTNALPDNESTSEVYDVIVNVDISVTSIEAGDLMFNYVKGEKGDPLTYDDLTPEQIAELQQPATEAIASIQEVELAVETAEGLRVQAELNRQTNTSTAISNAEQATDDANDAALLANEKANLANEKALLADEKAGLAATATTQANDARDGANSAAESVTNLVNSYATDLAAKELKANKQNSLEVDGTGTKFPTVDAVNANLAQLAGEVNQKFDAGNLIADVTFHGNKEAIITNLDTSTGVFTSVGHGFNNNDRVCIVLNKGVNFRDISKTPNPLYNSWRYIINATPDSFQISQTIDGNPITFTENVDIDYSVFHIEAIPSAASVLSISSIQERRIRAVYAVRSHVQGANSFTLTPLDYSNLTVVSEEPFTILNSINPSIYVYGHSHLFMWGYIDFEVEKDVIMVSSNLKRLNLKVGTDPKSDINIIKFEKKFIITSPNHTDKDITGISLSLGGHMLVNGSMLKLYKL